MLYKNGENKSGEYNEIPPEDEGKEVVERKFKNSGSRTRNFDKDLSSGGGTGKSYVHNPKPGVR